MYALKKNNNAIYEKKDPTKYNLFKIIVNAVFREFLKNNYNLQS